MYLHLRKGHKGDVFVTVISKINAYIIELGTWNNFIIQNSWNHELRISSIRKVDIRFLIIAEVQNSNNTGEN